MTLKNEELKMRSWGKANPTSFIFKKPLPILTESMPYALTFKLQWLKKFRRQHSKFQLAYTSLAVKNHTTQCQRFNKTFNMEKLI